MKAKGEGREAIPDIWCSDSPRNLPDSPLPQGKAQNSHAAIQGPAHNEMPTFPVLQKEFQSSGLSHWTAIVEGQELDLK